jgi:hypothetical protein
MTLNSIERDFLSRLSFEPWTSPPVFDHRLLDRLVREKYVTRETNDQTRLVPPPRRWD